MIKLGCINEQWQCGRCPTSGANLCWALGGIICNFTPILPYFQHWGNKPRPRLFFRVSKLSEDQKKVIYEVEHFFPRIQVRTKKKGPHQKWNTLFPRIQVQIWAQMHTRVKLLEGMQVKIILKVLGGIQSNFWGIYPPRVSAPLCQMVKFQFSYLQAVKS